MLMSFIFPYAVRKKVVLKTESFKKVKDALIWKWLMKLFAITVLKIDNFIKQRLLMGSISCIILKTFNDQWLRAKYLQNSSLCSIFFMPWSNGKVLVEPNIPNHLFSPSLSVQVPESRSVVTAVHHGADTQLSTPFAIEVHL